MKAVNFIFKKEYLIIFSLFIIYVFTAFNSVGFYKDDEHFQILEPIAYLLGLNNILLNDNSGYYWEWQFDHRIRPWLQPYLYFKLISFLKILGINDPFSWTLILRLINSLLGFISIVILFFSIKKYFTKDNNFKYYLIYFSFWFFPFLHTRTSSENLSITLFIFSFPFLLNFFLNKIKYNFSTVIFVSFIMGLSVVVKPQMIFTIFSIFLWVVFFKLDIYKIFLTITGFILAIILGLYIDFINWGFFTNTYVQIYKIQIIGERMKSFGSEPIWFYFSTIIRDMSPIFGFFYIVSILIFCLKKYKNVFSWLTFGTIFILIFFSHKETRFIFQIYIFAPFFFFYLMSLNYNLKIKNFIFYSSLISNLIFIIVVASFPANSKIDLYKYIYSQDLINNNLYFLEENPYKINNMEPHFYTSYLPNIKKFENQNIKEEIYLVTNNYYEHQKIESNKNCELKYSTYPVNLIDLIDNFKKRKMNWYFYKCKSQ